LNKVKGYFPLGISDKPPVVCPLVCMLLPGLMRDDTNMGRDEVLLTRRNIDPRDKCLTYNVEGHHKVNKDQLKASFVQSASATSPLEP